MSRRFLLLVVTTLLGAILAQGRSFTLEFTSEKRGILEELTLSFPSSFRPDWEGGVKIDVIGRGEVLLPGLETQSLGRHGSAYTRTRVGTYSLREGRSGVDLVLSDIDLRPYNGVDIRLVFESPGGRVPSKVKASYRLSSPEIPEEHRGALYESLDPSKVYSATLPLVQDRVVPAPSKVYSAKSMGLRGNGIEDDTPALDRAIATVASRGGGIIEFTPGTYNLRTVHLRSHVWLHLLEGAVLKAIPGFDEPEDTYFKDVSPNAGNGLLDKTPYDTFDNYMTKQDVGHSFFHNTMFFAERMEDIRIYGSGLINGDGVIYKDNNVLDQPIGRRADKMMVFKLCRNIEIGGEDCPSDLWYDEDKDEPYYLAPDSGKDFKSTSRMLSIEHGGHFVILATGTDDLRVHDIYCGADGSYRARDIFDFMECCDVDVRNIYSKCNGDDIVKFGSDCSLGFTRPGNRAIVRNIVGDTSCNLFQIGSETADDITDIWVDNLYVLATNKAGFSISSNDGGTVARIYLNTGHTGPLHSRTIMRKVSTPFFLSISNRGRVLGAQVEEFSFEENGKTRHELLVVNNPIGRVEDILLQGVTCYDTYAGSAFNSDRWKPWDGTQREYPAIFAGFKVPDGVNFTLPDGRMTGYIRNVTMRDVDLTVKGGHPEKDIDAYCPEIGVGKFNIRDLEIQPSFGVWARHVHGLTIDSVRLSTEKKDPRPAIVLDDVTLSRIGQVDVVNN